MADASTLAKVKHIVESDPARRYVVVSAPGKRCKDDIKITDVLYKCYEEVVNTGSCTENFAIIKERFIEMVKGLKIDFDIEKVLNDTEREIVEKRASFDRRRIRSYKRYF